MVTVNSMDINGINYEFQFYGRFHIIMMKRKVYSQDDLDEAVGMKLRAVFKAYNYISNRTIT
jgi:hypothetical protein